MSRLKREDFFGHEKIIKLSNIIAKKTRQDIYFLNIRDKDLQDLLIQNSDWLDYVGISIKRKSKNIITIKWENI